MYVSAMLLPAGSLPSSPLGLPDFTVFDYIAAATNAFNGALLARRPDHYKQFTIVGIILMALLGGIGGGVTRDVLLNNIPGPFTDPWYIVLCVGFGILGYNLAYGKGQLFREGLFSFATAFSLPWYAIVGAQKASATGLPIIGSIAIAVIATTAGRYYIDVTSGLPAKQFVRGEWFVGTAVLTAVVWLALDAAGAGVWWCAGVAFIVGFTVRLLALYRGWEEPMPKEPKGVVIHSDGRPLLGRKLAGKSERELRDLGLLVDDAAPAEGSAR